MKIAKKIIIIFLLICMFLNILISNTYATSQIISNNIDEINNEKYPGVKTLIQQMKKEHPNWNFKILYTKLNWEDVIKAENAHKKSLLPATYTAGQGFVCETCKNTLYEGGGWKCASSSVVQYLMDPRNFLNEYNVFQFLDIKYNEACTKDNLKKMVSGTFLDTELYINTLMDSGKKYNLNPYYLVARIIQEQGSDGTKPLCSGNPYTGKSGTTYSSLFNLYNIEATVTSTSNDIIENGLKKAQTEGWTTREASIAGGAKWIKENYTDFGQTNLYLQKFDVEDTAKGLYWHQYMQNVMAAQSEGRSLRKVLSDTKAIDNEYNFLIPVYENMPKAQDMDLVKINANPSLQLREGPSKDSKNIGLEYKDNVILRIKKAQAKDKDGFYWDLVMLRNGMLGYMARETASASKTYLVHVKDLKVTSSENKPVVPEKPVVPTTPENPDKPTTPEIPSKPKNEIVNKDKTAKLNKDTNVITMIPKGNTQGLEELIGEIKEVKDKEGKIVDLSSKLATGMKINAKYTVIVLGDVSGDGEVKSLDYIMIKNAIMGTKKLTDIEKTAADTSGEGNITSLDYIKVKNHIMETKNIILY